MHPILELDKTDPFKINESLDFSDEYNRIILKSGKINGEFAVFGNNMERVRSLGILPIFLTVSTMFHEAYRVAALYESGFTIGDARLKIGGAQYDDPAWKAVNDLRVNKMREAVAAMQNAEAEYRRMGSTELQIVTQDNEKVSKGLKALLFAMIIDSCTAFEVLSEDIFSVLHKLKPSDFPDPKAKKKIVGFRSRGRIRDAYRDYIKNPAVNTCLADKALDAIILLRNVFVHASGKADRDFMEGVNETPALSRFSTLSTGGNIDIDGGFVRIIINGYINAVVPFVVAMDNWITSNTP